MRLETGDITTAEARFGCPKDFWIDPKDLPKENCLFILKVATVKFILDSFHIHISMAFIFNIFFNVFNG